MDIENIKKLILTLKNEDNQFSMESYGDPVCGTSACICGWANYIQSPEDELTDFGDHERAGEWIGITDSKLLEQLFYSEDDTGFAHISRVTREEAIITLEKLIETGKVDWSHCATYEEVDWDGDNLV